MHLDVVTPGVIGPEGLNRAERSADQVLLVADDDGTPQAVSWGDFCLRQADAVVLVARADTQPPTTSTRPAPHHKPDLVLLGRDPGPDRRVAWVSAVDAWQLTLTDNDLAAAVRPVADRFAGRSLGLVLGGGGARGFAHVGVLRELEEAGLHVDRLAGSSIGAIIAAARAVARDGAELEELCYAEFVRRQPFSDWRLPTRSLASGHRVRAGLTRVLGADTVLEGLPRQLHVVSTDLASRTRQVHRRGNLVEAVLASSRLPILFAPLPDDHGRLLIDGGVLDNLPFDLLTERTEGPVVAVNIGMGGSSRGARTGPPRIPPLGETLVRTMMIGSGGAVAAAFAHGVVVVTPPTRGVGLLEFHQFDTMVQAGREAARTLLKRVDGWPGCPDFLPGAGASSGGTVVPRGGADAAAQSALSAAPD